MSSGIPSLTILSEEQKFNGDNLLQWNTNMNQLLGSKGLLGYIDGTILKPEPAKPLAPTSSTEAEATVPQPTPIYSTSPTLDEWVFRDHLARGHLTLNCTDLSSLGVITTGTAKEAWDSIQTEWGKSTDMRRSHAQEALNHTLFVEGTEIQDHVKLLRTRRAAVDNLSTTPMTDETWRGIIIRSIPPTPKWLPVIPSLYSMSSAADIISTLFAHGMIIGRNAPPVSHTHSSNTALAASNQSADGPCTNPKCKAKKRSTHPTKDCYWEGGGKEGQFPPGFGQRNRANAATTTPAAVPTASHPEHFVLSAQIPNTPGQSGVLLPDDLDDVPHTALISRAFQTFQEGDVSTFLDSGASDMMFIARDSFTDYKAITPRMGDSAKATDGKFEIVGEGTVSQRYQVEGKPRDITYTRALHTPTLNANLISVSSLDCAGLTITFGGGQGVVKKPDGTLVFSGKGANGMYLLETLDIPITAMTTLSQSVSLEQWHRRLAHCSPKTIQEMAEGNLVDGLRISDKTMKGKCEDCILGRRTRHPFDGSTTDKGVGPLDLVSFDLWGPSRVQSIGGRTYLMIIVDAGTSFKYGAYLSDKSDMTTLSVFEVYRTKAETLTGKKIRRVRTDRAFKSKAWEEYCQQHGITHEFTAPYSSAQNGLAERAIRTTIDDVRTLLRDSDLSHSYWAEAAAYSIDTRNLVPSRHHPGRIPVESFSGKKQNVSHLRVFGAKCWAKMPTAHGDSKLDPRSTECRLLGYATGSGNYKVQDITSRKVFVSRDVVFEEGQPHRISTSVGEKEIPLFDTMPAPPANVPDNVHAIPDPVVPVDQHQRDIPVEPRRSVRTLQNSSPLTSWNPVYRIWATRDYWEKGRPRLGN